VNSCPGYADSGQGEAISRAIRAWRQAEKSKNIDELLTFSKVTSYKLSGNRISVINF
jgi:hypothetical protein